MSKGEGRLRGKDSLLSPSPSSRKEQVRKIFPVAVKTRSFSLV